jgi:hypothetical protein
MLLGKPPEMDKKNKAMPSDESPLFEYRYVKCEIFFVSDPPQPGKLLYSRRSCQSIAVTSESADRGDRGKGSNTNVK